MRRPTIVVTVDPEGRVTVRVEGVPGPACERLSQPFRDALGTTADSQRTAEYYQAAAQTAARLRASS